MNNQFFINRRKYLTFKSKVHYLALMFVYFLLLQNKKHVLTWEDRLQVAVGTANGISYLHTAFTPLIHRDIKSANILLDCSNKPKVF